MIHDITFLYSNILEMYTQYFYVVFRNNANMQIQYSSIPRPANMPQGAQPQQAPVEPQPPAPQPQRVDQEHQNRDWLDVFYVMSRLMVFISIVYFYSSPLRFLFVVLFGLGLYLYQIGFFRNVNINNNNIVQGEGAEEQAPSRLMVVWTFFTTFFTSLIPEIPNVMWGGCTIILLYNKSQTQLVTFSSGNSLADAFTEGPNLSAGQFPM